MKQAPARVVALAAALSTLAGFVDAVGYTSLGGVFVSFMSGNSTRFAVGLGGFAIGGDPWRAATVAGAVIATFLLGVMLGAFAARRFTAHGRVAVLCCVTILLILAAGAASAGLRVVAVAGMTMAMGAENSAFQQDGEAAVGVTYMTGALVKVGQRLVAAAFGGPVFAFAPQLLLWAGLVAGGVTGALASRTLGLQALWIAAAAALALACASLRWAASPQV